jgi:mono/diheme cytochrome c family protein
MRGRRLRWLAGASLILVAAAAALGLPAARLCWRVRASNPVRRGVALAREIGCFSCHGDFGKSGIPDPSAEGKQVPAWGGGLWMMYVKDDAEVREFILDGVSRRRAASESAREERRGAAVSMPAYKSFLGKREVDDLLAAFEVLSGMKRPADDTAEGRGYQVAQSRQCFSCHGPGGSGGFPNPGSFTGFIPGWYGADFRDLVRSREEFETWIRTGTISRLSNHPVASIFIRRQRLKMPPYRNLTSAEREDLWSYVSWLGRTRGGLEAPSRSS